MSKSRYIRWVKQRIPRPRQSIRIPSADTVSVDKTSDEEGKWIRCRVCGFPINLERETLGVDDVGVGDSVQVQDFDYEEPNRIFRGSSQYPGNRFNRPGLNEGDYNTAYLDTLDMVGTAIQLDPNGNADPFTYTPRTKVITGGCPFCGSPNT